ncbi:alpha/beta hydrolase [Loigolactobacillus backii]|uniref:alpha/beta fold hydrolase n=1 Tax=Loigolactobacillus backii TaxID=375175 RepID=UPI0007F0C112|nr:alpha/beta hydrolase [Loigolactobacillus backii]ANK60299.1 alpha/beta hydrolase [Loigolactobacillus backii]ANK65181.1 alpha/beta hydrolase [Loigolactobacillus backii]ANK67739.1 alpha/beta hydrolase [Loigolactobacillus backii]OLF69253.1 alpha/beta hydrolase [Loigolactobacillus backii]PIO87034.1 alpha/beta hydrolase [Loigolactobacillus backii]
MNFTTNDFVRLTYTDEGQGQPIIILTGIGGYKEIWLQQITYLVARHYRVINLDCRNQGQSEQTAKGRRISRHAMDLAELIQQLKLKQVILLGNSMGAATIFAYLSLFGDQNVRAIIDVDQSPKMINDQTWTYGFKTLTEENFISYLRKPFGHSTFKHIDDQTFQAVQYAAKQQAYDAKLNFPFLLDHGLQDWRDVLSSLTCPALIIAGGNSPFFPPRFAQVAAKMAVRGTAVVIPEAGHIVMAEQSQAFNAVLGEFLANQVEGEKING